jgi:LPPG:FO 2-phospho-L-lactate transferase
LITVLAGGVGASRFLQGLVRIRPQEDFVIVSNTADDIELYGLHISPDIDIVMYTLAGMVDEEKGWGIEQDTFHCQEVLERFGCETWFRLGDRDLATHIFRTNRLRKGSKLSQVTQQLSKTLGLSATILPMTDDPVETRIITEDGEVHFEEYLIKKQMKAAVKSIRFSGIEHAHPAPNVISSIHDARAIIVAPSNPLVSIGPILTIRGVRDALKTSEAKIVAVSPIVRGSAIKGPADRMMRALGLEVSAFGVAQMYQDFLDGFVLDILDEDQKPRVERLGLKVVATNTLMNSLQDKMNLAKVCLDLAFEQT